MLDIGWSEILVIAIVLIVVVGPKDLPRMLRAFGQATSRMRKTANEFRRQFDEALREAELDDVKTIVDDARSLDPRRDIKKVFDPIRSAGEELRSSLNKTAAPATPVPPPPPEPVPSADAPAEPAPAVAAAAADTVVTEKPAKAAKKKVAPARAPKTTAKPRAKAAKAKADDTEPKA